MSSLILATSINVAAQHPIQLSLKQAVDIALDRDGNTRIQMADEMVRQAQAKATEARASLLPDISASVGQQSQTRSLAAAGLRSDDLPAGVAFPSVVGPYNTFDARGTASQKILDLSAIRHYQSAQAQTQATRFDYDATKDDTAALVARTYLVAVRTQALVETAQANVQLSEALLKLATSQKQAGTGTGIEVTRADVQLANDRQSLLVAETDFTRARLELLRSMGIDLDATIELIDRLSFTAGDAMSIQQAIHSAHESLSTLKAQKKREDSARLNHSSVALERAPSVTAFADYGVLGLSANETAPTRTFGVSVKLPIFDGGRRDARRAESASQYRQEKIRTADLIDETELRIRVAMDAVNSAEKQVAAAEQGLKLAENELEQAQRRYQAGVTNNVEVTDAQARLQRARSNRVSAIFNHAVARVDLAAATGTIQPLLNNWR
jgi:outer membrane protein TolC